MITVEKLNEFGADTVAGLGRCMNNENLYLRLVGLVINQPEFDSLKQSVEAGDLERGFEAAHALKGVLGNLALTPIYDKVCEITELLRNSTQTDYSTLLQQITELRAKLAALTE